MALLEGNIEVPVSLLIWGTGIVFSAVVAMGSFCGHILLQMNGTLNKMAQEDMQYKTLVGARLEVLERHDSANQEESRALLKFLESRTAV